MLKSQQWERILRKLRRRFPYFSERRIDVFHTSRNADSAEIEVLFTENFVNLLKKLHFPGRSVEQLTVYVKSSFRDPFGAGEAGGDFAAFRAPPLPHVKMTKFIHFTGGSVEQLTVYVKLSFRDPFEAGEAGGTLRPFGRPPSGRLRRRFPYFWERRLYVLRTLLNAESMKIVVFSRSARRFPYLFERRIDVFHQISPFF